MTDFFRAGRTVVVTGGAGFVGSTLVERLLEEGCRVHVLDDLSAGRMENLPQDHPGLAFTLLDLTAPDAAGRGMDQAIGSADFVFHLASPIGVRRAHEQRYDITRSILAGGVAVVDACRRHGVPLLYTSSSEVYGTGRPEPLREEDCGTLGLEPRWGYAASKFALEHLVAGLSQQTGLPAWIVRFFNVAGGRQRPDTGLCIAHFVHRAMRDLPLVVHGDGRQQRAFLHVRDAVEGLVTVARTPRLQARAVNLGGPIGYPIRDVAERVRALVNPGGVIEHRAPQDLFGPAFVAAGIRVPDLSLIHAETAWQARHTLEDMVRDCWNALRFP